MRANYIMLPTQANGAALQFYDASTGHVARNVAFCDTPEMAAAIARACTSHEELVDAVKRLLHCMSLANWEGDDAAIFARAAIRKALGEEE